MKVGLIGSGLQGWRRARAVLDSGDDELVIVADVDEGRARSLGKFADAAFTTRWEDVTEAPEVEAVIVCTPPDLHAEAIIAALEAGKHALCEKPLSRNIQEAEAVLRKAEETGRKVICGFNHRYHPALKQAKLWVDASEIGAIDHIRSRHGIGGRQGYENEWRADIDVTGGGELMDQGLHSLDLFRWFLGEFTEAFGIITTAFWDIKPCEDNVFALLRTGEGQVASLHASWTQWKNLFSFEIFGQEGYVLAEGLGGSYGVERAVLGRRDYTQPEQVIEYRGGDVSWNGEWSEFTAAIQEDRQPLGNVRDGYESLRLADAIYRSARTGTLSRVSG